MIGGESGRLCVFVLVSPLSLFIFSVFRLAWSGMFHMSYEQPSSPLTRTRALDLLHGAMICLANWMYLISHFGDGSASKQILWCVFMFIHLRQP